MPGCVSLPLRPCGKPLPGRFLVGLLLRRVLLVWLGFALEDDARVRSEPLVVRVLDGFPDMNITVGEMQVVIGSGIGREPVLAVDLLAVGHKFGEKVLVALAADVRNTLAAGLDDLEVMVVHPDASLE